MKQPPPSPARSSTSSTAHPTPRPPYEGPPKHIVLYKPFDVLSQFTAEEPGQRTLAEFGLPKEVNVAGRLDRDSEGLLLLTTDGILARRLLDPKFGHQRRYLVQIEGEPNRQALDELRRGVEIRVGKSLYRTRPCTLELLQQDPELPPRTPPIRYRATIPTRWIALTLSEGKNRQVRKMTAAIGFPTLRLVRAAFGRLTLNEGPLKGLQPGEWVEVSAKDLRPR
jgi:23S rRNA pseudouridine2457 synthase